jgi:hypothetical protein
METKTVRLRGMWTITPHRYLGVVPTVYLQNGSEVQKVFLGVTHAHAARRAERYYERLLVTLI